ncbi:zinc ribbon domain-containing protein [Amycolatopsis sp. NPDC003676]
MANRFRASATEAVTAFFTTGVLPRWIDTKTWGGGLSRRQWDSVVAQAIAAHRSWLGNCENEFRRIVARCALSEACKRDLFYLSKAHAWHTPVTGEQAAVSGKRSVRAEVLKLARRIFKQIRTRVRQPDMRRVRTMVMDGKIAAVEISKGAHADYWVRVSTLQAGKPVRIPLHTHRAFLERLAKPEARLANHCQICVAKDGVVTYRLAVRTPVAEPREGGRTVGVDWGMSTLLATSDGHLHGRGFLDRLRAYDDRLQPLVASLQRNGIELGNSRRYRALVNDIRGFVANETNRCLNRVAADPAIMTLAVERLDFQGMVRQGQLSRRMRRLTTIAGRGAVRAEPGSLREDAGLSAVEVNPAHTSRECGGCGYTHPGNRRTQDTFRCRFCGKIVHADIGGARTILGRSQRKRHWLDRPRGHVLTTLDNDFQARWGLSFADVVQRRNTTVPRVAPTSAALAAKAHAHPRVA